MKNKKRKSFIQWLLAIFALVFIGVVASINGIQIVFGATVTGLTVSGLTAENSGGTWTGSGTTLTGSVEASVSSGCSGDSYSAQTSTLTLKNTKSTTAVLSFSYSLTLSGGSAKVDGTSVTTNSTFEKSLAANGTMTVSITSNASNSTATSIVLSNISLVSNATVNTIFNPATNGSYTVSISDGTGPTTITSSTTYYKSSSLSYTVTATPASGYKFVEWQLNGNFFSSNNPYTFQQDVNNATVTCIFVSASAATFLTGGKYYYDLGQANTAATSGDKKIVVAADGEVSAGSYTISSGVTLLVPNDNSNTIMQAEPTTTTSFTTPTAFRTLTIASNCTLTVYGSISLPSAVAATGQLNGSNGRPTGPDGRIKMMANSTIVLKSGAKLYCWGYIFGTGTVEAESGSNVYECFQIKNFRGGTCTNNMIKNSERVFPFNQYYVQNIEASLKMWYGATETLFTCITMSVVGTVTSSFVFIGTSSGMFRLTAGYIVKTYEPSTDRLIVDAEGAQLNLSSITVTVYKSINSSDYVLPVTNNITINLKSNTTVTTTQDLCFLPGSVLTIDSTSTLKINNSKSVYVYDSSDWNNTSNFYVIGYTVANGTTTKRTTANLIDAEVDLNGSVEVASGAHFYTTETGANIHSSGKSGQITFNSVSSNGTTYQMNGTDYSGSIYSMAVVNAKLKNGPTYIANGGEEYYSESVTVGDIIYYNRSADKWGKTAQTDIEITVNFRDNGNSSNVYQKSYLYPTESFVFPTQSEAGFVNQNGYKLRKWITNLGESYDLGEEYIGELEEGYTFYAYYGGWFTNIDNVTSYMYKTSDTNPTYPSGIETVEALSGEGEETYLFEGNGILSSDTRIVHSGSDYYYVELGVVKKDAGIVYSSETTTPDSFYYIDANGKAITSTVRYISNIPSEFSGTIKPGYYEFASNGKMLFPGVPQSISSSDYVKDGTNGSGNTVYGYGLFHLTISGTTHLYYGKDDGTIVKNCTFYVKKTNDYFINGISSSAILIEEGVYYFDNNGYMWYGNNLLDGTSAEFGVIVSGNGVIIGRNN